MSTYQPRSYGYSSTVRYRSSRAPPPLSPPSLRSASPSHRTMKVDPYWMLVEQTASDRARDLLGQFADEDPLPRDEVYVEKLNQILSAPPCIGVPPQPSCVAPGVYVGTQANAENLDCLKRHRITYVLNCAGLPESLKKSRAARYAGTNIMYAEIAADDEEEYPIKNHFSQAHTFIERGLLSGGRVLVHCTGVSRCGAVAISYLVRSGQRLFEAASNVKKERRCVLCNTGFMRQLVEHARAHGMLDPEPGHVTAPRYGRVLDKHRITSAHLPLLL